MLRCQRRNCTRLLQREERESWRRERGLLELVVSIGEEEDEGSSKLSNWEREELQRLRGKRTIGAGRERVDELLAF